MDYNICLEFIKAIPYSTFIRVLRIILISIRKSGRNAIVLQLFWDRNRIEFGHWAEKWRVVLVELLLF